MENYEKMNPAEENAGASSKEKSVEVCSNCGAFWAEGHAFCPNCGMPKLNKNICGKCGAQLQDGQGFCHKCGQKVGLAADRNDSSAMERADAGADKPKQKKRKIPIIIGAAAVMVILLVVAGVKILPNVFMDSAGYFEQGDYERAWKKAKTDEEKQNVINAYLVKGEFDKAWEKAETEEQKEKVIEAYLDKGAYEEAYEKATTDEKRLEIKIEI